MAESNPDLDLGQAPGEEKKGGGNLKLVIIVAVAALALGAAGAWFMLPSGGETSGEQTESAEAEQPVAEPEQAEPEAIYQDLEKPFVANLPDHHLVQVVVSVMSYDQAAIDQLNHHKAAISHEILSLLRQKTYEGLSAYEGQEALRGELKDKIQSIIRRNESDPGIEEVYLTDFRIQ